MITVPVGGAVDRNLLCTSIYGYGHGGLLFFVLGSLTFFARVNSPVRSAWSVSHPCHWRRTPPRLADRSVIRAAKWSYPRPFSSSSQPLHRLNREDCSFPVRVFFGIVKGTAGFLGKASLHRLPSERWPGGMCWCEVKTVSWNSRMPVGPGIAGASPIQVRQPFGAECRIHLRIKVLEPLSRPWPPAQPSRSGMNLLFTNETKSRVAIGSQLGGGRDDSLSTLPTSQVRRFLSADRPWS